jgi:predicted DNA-binding WGR domain protein
VKREFHLQDDRSNKFWTIEVVGNDVVTTHGRIGAKPRETRKAWPDAATAAKQSDREILGKRRKGYLEGAIAGLPAWSPRLPPRFVAIAHDDYHASHVGTHAGGQFFLTEPFVPQTATTPREEYVALYLFDEFGLLTEARIFDAAAEGVTTQEAYDAFRQRLLATLDDVAFGDIAVAPFAVEKFGRTFGLVFDPGHVGDEDDDEPDLWVNVLPGDYMAFYPPWDGDYDT